MQTNLAETVIVTFCLIILVLGSAVYLPRMGRLLALYGLHGLRDRVYRACLTFEAGRETRLYRDAELLLTILIKAVREAPYSVSVSFVLASLERNHALSDKHKAKAQRYSEEREDVFRGADGQRSHDEIVGAVLNARRFVWIFVCMGHPMMQVISLFVLAIRTVTAPSRWFGEGGAISELVSQQVSAAMTEQRSLAESVSALIKMRLA